MAFEIKLHLVEGGVTCQLRPDKDCRTIVWRHTYVRQGLVQSRQKLISKHIGVFLGVRKIHPGLLLRWTFIWVLKVALVVAILSPCKA